MYNPCRGGVRGGADQFTWESVKTDKHRENYLGHSIKAPVGRWQKGKDLSWYAKERKNDEDSIKSEKTEMAAVKRAEEEAMLIALGHKISKKESQQALSKEDISEALKRNTGERDELNIERIDGVGATSRRAALMTGISKDSHSRNEGIVFEGQKTKNFDADSSNEQSLSHKRSKSKKKSKKHKKEKKKKHNQDISDSYESDNEAIFKKKYKKHKQERDLCRKNSSIPLKEKHKKKSKQKHHYSSDSESGKYKISESKVHEKHKTHQDIPPRKKHRHDTSESE